MKNKSCEEVYDSFCAQGEYRTREVNLDEVRKMLSMAQEDVKYLEFLLKQKQIHWRVIFTLYYDVLRLLCEALARSDGIKVSNHQGCFAYICMKHQDLELDWNFLERVRDVRNKAKYEGRIVTGKNWREIEIQMKLYVSTLEKEVEEKISE